MKSLDALLDEQAQRFKARKSRNGLCPLVPVPPKRKSIPKTPEQRERDNAAKRAAYALRKERLIRYGIIKPRAA